MISGAGRNIAYDYENRVISINKAGVLTEFVYDGNGRRAKKVVSNGATHTTTIYIEDLYEKETME